MARHDHGHPSDHGHGHHGHGRHAHGPVRFDRAFAIGIGLNLAFVAIEAGYGLAADSLALLADAGHNLSDVLSLALAWGASLLGRRRPSRRRTYGLRRSSILAALVNAVVLYVVVGAIAVEAVGRLNQPQPVEEWTVLIVAAVGIVINLGTAALFHGGQHGDINLRGAYLHMLADGAVSLGVVASALVIMATGWLWLDAAASLAIAALIALGTWSLLRESMDLAMDAVPTGIDPAAVARFLASRPGVTEVHDLHIWAMSTTETALTAHLVCPIPAADDQFLAETASELAQRFAIAHTTLQIERGDDAHQCRLAAADSV